MIYIGNKNALVVVLFFVFIGIMIFITSGLFSSITDIGTIDKCRIVIDGSVCDDYTQCTYLNDRDVSCITGYKLIKTIDIKPTLVGFSEEYGESHE